MFCSGRILNKGQSCFLVFGMFLLCCWLVFVVCFVYGNGGFFPLLPCVKRKFSFWWEEIYVSVATSLLSLSQFWQYGSCAILQLYSNGNRLWSENLSVHVAYMCVSMDVCAEYNLQASSASNLCVQVLLHSKSWIIFWYYGVFLMWWNAWDIKSQRRSAV